MIYFVKSIKHILWNLALFVLDYVFLNAPKNYILKFIFRFQIGKNTSLHTGLRFYRFGNVKIGDGSVINRCALIDNRGHIDIGHGVSISQATKLFTAGHKNDQNFTMKVGAISIGNNCILYSNCIICPNVSLGEGCIVYPGSVVFAGVYEDGSVLQGNPATVVRKTKIFDRRFNYPHLFAM